MKILVSIIIMLGVLTPTGKTAPITMLSPPPYFSTDADHVCLVGITDAPRVEIVMNKRTRSETNVIDSVFHHYISFGYGVNEIVLRSLYEDTIMNEHSVSRIEILSSPYSTGRLEKLYPVFQFHSSGHEAKCRGCHSSGLDSASVSTNTSPCTECHREFFNRTLLHTTLEREDCGTCHNRQAGQIRKTRNSGSRNPCYHCHHDKIEKFDQEYIHGPVAGGSCSVCHDPHGSKFDNSLINEEEVLCFSCHEFGREFKELPIQHGPFRDGHCGACHDPHATSNRWVLAKSSETLCFECHSPQEGSFRNHIHPYNVKPKHKHSSSVQLSRSGTLECISCHDPHASRTEHLLRSSQKDTCMGCHTDKL